MIDDVTTAPSGAPATPARRTDRGIEPEKVLERAQMERDTLMNKLRTFRDQIDHDLAMLDRGGTDDVGSGYAESVAAIIRLSAKAEARMEEAIAYQEGLR